MKKVQKQEFACRRGGLTIRGHVWGEGDNMGRAAILSHGFLSNEKTMHDYARVLVEMGYLTFTYDFCGGGLGVKSDGKTADMTVLTEKEDLLCVYRHVSGLPGIKSVSLMGCSQGGFVSALAAKEMGAERVDRLVLFYPALCIPDDARRGKMMFFKFDPANIPDLLGRFPMKLGGDYARTMVDMDPYREIGGYAGPTLLVHGDADKIVSVDYSRRAKEVYPRCRYVEIPGAGHGFSGPSEETALTALREFMQSP